MSTYTRGVGDKFFRRVPLFNSATPKFEPFVTDNQLINYNEREQILEILHNNGETELFGGVEPLITIYYGTDGSNKIWVSCNEVANYAITARLWLRNVDGTGFEYKIPCFLKTDQFNRISFQVPGGNRNIEIIGDKYFNRVFTLDFQGQ